MNKGTSQELRKNKALIAESISMDERSLLEMMQFTLKFSQNVNFYNLQKRVIDNWKSFLLNDSAFVIAMIASTDINDFKIDADDSETDTNQNNATKDIKQTTQSIYKTLEEWATLLKRSGYKGTLLKEINLILSLNNNHLQDEKVIEYIK